MLKPGRAPPFNAPSLPPIEDRGARPRFCVPVIAAPPALAAPGLPDEFDEGCVTRGRTAALMSVSFPETWLYGYLLSFGLGGGGIGTGACRLALLAGKMAAHHGNHDTGCQDNCDRMEPSQSKEESVMNPNKPFAILRHAHRRSGPHRHGAGRHPQRTLLQILLSGGARLPAR